MKTLASLTFTLFLTIAAASAGEGKFYSHVIHATDEAFVLHLPANKFIKITNFTHSGTSTDPDNFPTGAVHVYQGANGLPGTTALYSTLPSTTREVHEDVYIAGPAIVYVPALPGATLLFSYLLGNN